MNKRSLIILAEDDDDLRAHFKEILEQKLDTPYEVRAYENGCDALDALQQLSAQDMQRAILVSDYQMPHMDGLKLSGTLRKTMPEIPILIWSRGADNDLMYLLRKNGDHAMAKTTNYKDITAGLETTLAHFHQSQQGANGPKTPLYHATRPPQGPARGV